MNAYNFESALLEYKDASGVFDEKKVVLTPRVFQIAKQLWSIEQQDGSLTVDDLGALQAFNWSIIDDTVHCQFDYYGQGEGVSFPETHLFNDDWLLPATRKAELAIHELQITQLKDKKSLLEGEVAAIQRQLDEASRPEVDPSYVMGTTYGNRC